MATPKWKTKDGFEYQFGINHLGHFKLTVLLLPIMKKSGGGRIVCLSSEAHRFSSTGSLDWNDIHAEKSYGAWSAYGNSKLANVMFASYLNKLLQKDNIPILAMSVHPGGIMTSLQRELNIFTQLSFIFLLTYFSIGKTPSQGASTSTFCGVHPSIKIGGNYYDDCNVSKCIDYANNEEEQKKTLGIK